MLSSLQGLFASLSARLIPHSVSSVATPVLSASRPITTFEAPTEPRTYPDRAGEVSARLEPLGARGEVLAERFHWLVRVSEAVDRPFYREAVYHLDRLLQLEPWHDGQNTNFEYLAYQIFEAVVMNKDIASFVFLLSIMASERRSLEGLESLARHEKMEHYFGLVPGVLPEGVPHFGYDHAVKTVMTLDFFKPVRPEILRFLSTAILKREGKLPAAGIASDVYCTSAHTFVEFFGSGLGHSKIGVRFRKAIQEAANSPLGFLWMNRLVHLMMSPQFAGKLSEFQPEQESFVERLVPRPLKMPDVLARIEEARKNKSAAAPACGSLPEILSTHSIPHSLRLVDALRRKTVHIEAYGLKAFESVVRLSGRQCPDDILAIYRLLPPEKGVALIQMREQTPFEEAVVALHEFVHIEQDRSHGQGWVDRNVLEAEREALAVETWFRIVNGDFRLYDRIAALSPFGFEKGLWIAAEQLYLRLKSLPV